MVVAWNGNNLTTRQLERGGDLRGWATWIFGLLNEKGLGAECELSNADQNFGGKGAIGCTDEDNALGPELVKAKRRCCDNGTK